MDQGRRKLTTMQKALHRLYVSRKEGGRGIACIQDKHGGRLITVIRNNRKHKHQPNRNNEKLKMGRKQTVWTLQVTNKRKSDEKTWTWLRKRNLKKETESLLIAAQNTAMRINYIKARIDKTQQNCKCRLRGDRDERLIT